MSRFGVIVDGYSTGAGLAKEFLACNIACLHVQSNESIPKVYAHTYEPDHYHAHYVYSGNIDALAKDLKQYQPAFVIAGAECGIELADSLCETIGLYGNGTQLSANRRNKYLMLERIKTQGIEAIPSFLATTVDEVIDWAEKQSVWPLVVKPLNSAGGEGVKFCYSSAEAAEAHSAIISTKINMLGFENKASLIQHHIAGEEYVVNLVSYEDQHKLCELWNYTHCYRSEGKRVYDTAQAVNFDIEKHCDVVNYAVEVIRALGIEYGPSHVEIIKNAQGCYLIEVGARLMGANLPFSLLGKCVSTPQALYTVMAYASPERFKKNYFQPYRVIQPLKAVFMISNQSGRIKQINAVDEIKSLSSFHDMKLAVKSGDFLKETVDYQTSPGMVYLSHQDPEIIAADKQTIRKLEEKMFLLEN